MCQCYDFGRRINHVRIVTSMKAYMEKKQKTKLELRMQMFLVISRYPEIDDEACVMWRHYLENDTLIDTDGRDKLVGKLKGYQDKLYIDPVTKAFYNRRYFEDEDS